MADKSLIALSGGIDSTTTLALALDYHKDVLAVCFTYGSKHNQFERLAVEKIVAHYGVGLLNIDLTRVFECFKSDLLLSGDDIPEGHYEEESMTRTVVPARNLIFASVLTGLAGSIGANKIWLGVHAGDHAIYPDCRPEFVHALNMVAPLALGKQPHQFIVATPFLYNTKAEILRAAINLKVPLQHTRTCYKHQPIACGKCGACQERLLAFKENRLDDPIPYESREIIPKIGA